MAHEPVHRRKGQPLDLRFGADAVGGIGGVSEIIKFFLGHDPPQMPQHADAAHARVNDPNIIFFCIHGSTCLALVFLYVVSGLYRCNYTKGKPRLQGPGPGLPGRKKEENG